MNIVTGLFDNMVLQRAANGRSDTLVGGEARVTGRVFATVKKGRTVLKGFSRKAVGKCARNAFSARLAGIPCGGPYEVELATSDGSESVVVSNVLVGDVWIAAGQSNMCGTGGAAAPAKPHPMVRAFYHDDTWRPGVDPIHHHYRCVDPIHVKLDGGETPSAAGPEGPGMALTFALEMQKLTGIPQGVLACAHGGSGMDQWNPSLKGFGGDSLYGALLRRIRKNGGRVAGMIWYQGESEADTSRAIAYPGRMERLIAEFRADVGDPLCPVAIVQLCRVVLNGDCATQWNSIREHQRNLPRLIPNITVVPSIDMTLTDLIHLDAKANVLMGRRLAGAMHALREGRGAGLPPISLKRVTWEPAWCQTHVLVEFENVAGSLVAGDRPAGFTIRGENAPETVFGVELEGNVARVKTSVLPGDIERHHLWYGYGENPYCNIRDEAGRSLPAFGPISIPGPRFLTSFVRALRVSRPVPADAALSALNLPARPEDMDMAIRVFGEDFCNCRQDITDAVEADTAIFFACDFMCDESMELAVLLGADGPLKVWVDGKVKSHVPTGKCPARPDQHVVRVAAGRGRHKLVVALGSNRREAWGMFMRFERLPRAGKRNAIRLPRILG